MKKKKLISKDCVVCNTKFKQTSTIQIYCNVKCRNTAFKERHGTDKYKASQRQHNLTFRYKNWTNYISHLLLKKNRHRITVSYLLFLLARQDYKCAISGLPLTHQRGSIYNATLDRKIAGGEYVPENVQLVCKCVNSWRNNIKLDVFINICKAVTIFNKGIDRDTILWYNALNKKPKVS